ncbi:hypothetical protein BD311DRAFT_782839 [Dichomitus squalens]|uniref:Uncharacterized protein n=1 Tax=Dichomitus squalens TaxID=114155 RepID=A0A4Q9M3X2_9APHY|nr:hypothetical protein BD311DRAFT_782839 [Dichomitus squalens]
MAYPRPVISAWLLMSTAALCSRNTYLTITHTLVCFELMAGALVVSLFYAMTAIKPTLILPSPERKGGASRRSPSPFGIWRQCKDLTQACPHSRCYHRRQSLSSSRLRMTGTKRMSQMATRERLTVRLGGNHATRCNSPSPQPSRSAAESPAVQKMFG